MSATLRSLPMRVMPKGEWRPGGKTDLVSAVPSPSLSRSRVVRSGLGHFRCGPAPNPSHKETLHSFLADSSQKPDLGCSSSVSRPLSSAKVCMSGPAIPRRRPRLAKSAAAEV